MLQVVEVACAEDVEVDAEVAEAEGGDGVAVSRLVNMTR